MSSLRPTFRLVFPLALAMLAGCASMSNPTNWPSVPVRRLPDELLGKPREEQLDIPQPLLRQARPPEHVVDKDDILGVLIPDILGEKNTIPPVIEPKAGSLNQTIGVGYPIPVLEDGTISLPYIDPIPVKGLTIPQIRDKVRATYLDSKIVNKETADRVLVTLSRPRNYHVMVVRQDAGGNYVNNVGTISAKRGSGIVLDLPAYENDVLNALTRSGGLPGNDARNEVIIQRGALQGELTTMTDGPIPGIETIRIPLRLRPGETVPFRPEDVVLKNGDIVFIQSRDTEVFYTGGLIPPREWPIPRDNDLDVLEAVMQTGGPLANGGVFNNNLSGSIVSQGVGAPSPSLLTVIRRAPGNRQILVRVDLNRAMQDPRERILVQPGDVLILQETIGESLTRYLTGAIRSNFVTTYLRTSTSLGTATINSP